MTVIVAPLSAQDELVGHIARSPVRAMRRAGCVTTTKVDAWFGILPPPAQATLVGLNAPVPEDGDVPGTWMMFPAAVDDVIAYNTSELFTFEVDDSVIPPSMAARLTRA